jgi:hypothetical protein
MRLPVWKAKRSLIVKVLLYPVAYSWGAAVFQIAAFTAFLWWFRVTPPSGFAVAALAIAAVVMAVRAQRFTRGEEIAWIVIAFLLFGIEIRAIRQDREDFANKEAARRTEENAEFQGIVKGLTASIEQSRSDFDATMKELSINQNTLTGAHSICYLGPVNIITGQTFLAFIHKGEFPLYGVSARVTVLGRNGNWIPGNPGEVQIPVGDIIKGHASVINIQNGLVTKPSDYFNSNIFFTARNGDWTELLREQKVGGQQYVALRVIGSFGKRPETICEIIDPKFPRNANGDIDDNFKAGPKAPPCQ